MSGVMQKDLSVGADKYFKDKVSQGVFEIQKCQQCEKAIFYHREICPHCGSLDLVWFQPSGKGTVYSTTIVRRKEENGGDYNVALIDLDEGCRLMSAVADGSPERVQIGQKVKLLLVDEGDSKLIKFKIEGDNE